ncbi:serine/arginine repetitive matrix protein 1-like isoform X3 [Mugil cephalus]|uniref:serine/arginine repetitive matrix protein 1-like isoform X3 n=1 Tax=Mugil cephalus TaxID=48193 RepID=UPI001FB73926|nr:serine/arginine repetitive matrix protein 1-like isoform X3 [Mugil cephalus]
MYSNKSEYSHRRQYSDRSVRQRDDYDDGWEERREAQRPQDSHYKYGRDGRRSAERAAGIREFSDSPKRQYSKDSNWSRNSPVRRRMSSPTWGGSQQKRQRFAEDDESDYRYRCETSTLSADSVPHAHEDFKDNPPPDEDFRYRRSPPGSRHRQRHEEFAYRQRHDDLTYRQLSESCNDRDGHKRSRSRERMRLQDHPTKIYAKPRERTRSPSTSTYREDYHQGRARFPPNDSSAQGAAVPDQRPTKGFQRFLDVLNKGVNVDVLTKIVTQTPTEVPASPSSFVNFDDRPWSPSRAEKQQRSHSNNRGDERETSNAPVSPRSHRRSLSPRRGPLSDVKCLQRGVGEQSYSRSKSPSGMEKMTLTPEDEHKHKQMQDVLQAIGLDLGFEELGQMSNRIQERLYGKKDNDWAQKASKEGGTTQTSSLKRHNRSSSSRSSFSPVPQDCYSYSAQSDGTELDQPQVHESVEYSQEMSSGSLQDTEKRESNSQDSTAALQAFSYNSTYSVSQPPPPPPVMPMYSPVNSPLLPYTTQPPALPPVLPHVGPRFFLPPFLPPSHNQPLNIFPAMLTQTRHLFPPQMSNRRPALLPLPHLSAVQPVNTTQKAKTVQRTRFLQVIDTKQPG